jgi:hypothetical protein
MSLPPPPAPISVLGPVNPIEAFLMSLNTNTYLVGMSMILLNLGGRHLAMGLTPEQDKFFQGPWIRRAMLFVVIFVATRNVFTAFWLSVGLVLLIGYLLNEHSDLYLFGDPVPLPPAPTPAPPTIGLTTEEQEIFKRLHDKLERNKSQEALKQQEAGKPQDSLQDNLVKWHSENMALLRKFIS